LAEPVPVSASAYAVLQQQLSELALVVRKFPLAIVRAGLESVIQLCDQLEADETKKDSPETKQCAAMQYKLKLLAQIVGVFEVAQVGLNKAAEEYREYVQSHPELHAKSGLYVPQNAGRIVLTDGD